MLTPRLLNAQTEREALIEHLLKLEPEDRHARFGRAFQHRARFR